MENIMQFLRSLPNTLKHETVLATQAQAKTWLVLRSGSYLVCGSILGGVNT